MKIFFIGICIALSVGVYAQTVTTRFYPVQQGQHIHFKFDYPVVKVSTWDDNKVSIVAHVNINNDENDSAFTLESKTIHDTLVISDHIKDMDKLPNRYTITRNGKKMVFKSKDQYLEERRKGGAERTSEGQNLDIVVEIKVPVHSTVNIKSIYGIVELTDFNTAVSIDATYGGIDATLTSAHTGKLQATTSYGRIYSNLELKITNHTERDFYQSITAEPGTGPAYSFTSTYGKIYLRKP